MLNIGCSIYLGMTGKTKTSNLFVTLHYEQYKVGQRVFWQFNTCYQAVLLLLPKK